MSIREPARPVTAKQLALWAKASELTRPGFVRPSPPVYSAHHRSAQAQRTARNPNEAREEP